MSNSSNFTYVLNMYDSIYDDSNINMTSALEISVSSESNERLSPERRRRATKRNFKNTRQIEYEDDSLSDIEDSEKSHESDQC